ncbi:MAG TPA: hypothetical protein VL358_12205 [Caulobacteraceae bacterium]|jgi:hypothetical protein|nr:hypothetical protein [Caulobacteraceae bacterium]
MPLYFFHVRDGSGVGDDTGTDLPTLEAARIHAVAFAGEMLKDNAAKFWQGDEWVVEVTDDRGFALFSLSLMASNAPAVLKNGPIEPQRALEARSQGGMKARTS